MFKVKRHLTQTIIAMGYHGYLALESGNLMIEFILKQCSLPEDPVDVFYFILFYAQKFIFHNFDFFSSKEKTSKSTVR